jgi:hypothetical protein
MGDTTPFDSTIFDEMDAAATPAPPGSPRSGSSNTEEMARRSAILQPQRDPNEIRASYDLPPLEGEALADWLQGQTG